MEDTIDDFFNEIDQIAPPKDCGVVECAWQECFDSGSGYTYYWNVKTNQVTWDMPNEYKVWKDQNPTNNSGNRLSKAAAPLFPSALPSSTKIYKIQDDSPSISLENRQLYEDKGKLQNKLLNNVNTTEKLVLIPSYGEGSDSETEVDKEIKQDNTVGSPKRLKANSNQNSRSASDEEDIDLLTKLQNRAKILKELGGELPPDVKKIVEQNGSNAAAKELTMKESTSGFSLVAGYGDSEDEEEGELKTTVRSISPQNDEKIAVSTLFPIAKPIDIKQFLQTEKEPEVESIGTKVFHRKRRIGIDFNLDKSTPVSNIVEGLGFKTEVDTNSSLPKKPVVNYPGFKSGGLIFLKSDDLNPNNDSDKTDQTNEECNKSKTEIMKKIEETHKTLNEKLTFLSEGRDPVSPVQIIIIQMQTLYEAMKAGSLTVNYLNKWLKETCSELVKLEKDAAPSGWLLQWDRINKRYYYRNQQTGESQWEYPQPDIVGGDEAMDICTTPPPTVAESAFEEPPLAPPLAPPRPPPPPRIKSPTPPPPPTISKTVKQRKKVLPKTPKNVPLPIEESSPSDKFDNLGEPLPPGVDSTPEPPQAKDVKVFKKDALGLELNSFYSDLAAMETTTINNGTNDVETIPNVENTQTLNTLPENTILKKKKKSKVKLVEGLAMKKKGVSKLVERWKNVQKDYN